MVGFFFKNSCVIYLENLFDMKCFVDGHASSINTHKAILFARCAWFSVALDPRWTKDSEMVIAGELIYLQN